MHRLVPAVASVILLAVYAFAAIAAAQSARSAKDAYTRALELEGKGDSTGALSLLWEAASLAPRDAEIQNRLGEALDRIGALDAAIDAFRRALAERPAFRKAANNLILTLVKAGKGPEAVERARQLVAGAPGDADVHFTLGLALSEQDVGAAAATFRRVLELAPRHTLARYNLALILKRDDRDAEAIAELTRAIEIEPRAQVYYALGVLHWQRGELDRAMTALRGALAAESDYVDAHHTLGTVLAARGDLPGAVASLRRAIALRPDLIGAHNTLARVLRQSGDERGADRQFAEADRLRRRAQLEREAGVWTTTGTARLDAGDPTAAAEHFRRAIAIFEPYAPAHYQLGRALQRLGQKGASQAAFARARQLNPSLLPPQDP